MFGASEPFVINAGCARPGPKEEEEEEREHRLSVFRWKATGPQYSREGEGREKPIFQYLR
jgi:hypothetical protein